MVLPAVLCDCCCVWWSVNGLVNASVPEAKDRTLYTVAS